MQWLSAGHVVRSNRLGSLIIVSGLAVAALIAAPRLVPALRNLPLASALRPYATNFFISYIVVLISGQFSVLITRRLRGVWPAVAAMLFANVLFEFILPTGNGNVLSEGNTKDPFDAIAGVVGILLALLVAWMFARWGTQPLAKPEARG